MNWTEIEDNLSTLVGTAYDAHRIVQGTRIEKQQGRVGRLINVYRPLHPPTSLP